MTRSLHCNESTPWGALSSGVGSSTSPKYNSCPYVALTLQPSRPAKHASHSVVSTEIPPIPSNIPVTAYCILHSKSSDQCFRASTPLLVLLKLHSQSVAVRVPECSRPRRMKSTTNHPHIYIWGKIKIALAYPCVVVSRRQRLTTNSFPGPRGGCALIHGFRRAGRC